MVIQSKEDLIGEGLHAHDIVLFQIGDDIYKYHVFLSYLVLYGSEGGDIVFRILGIDKNMFCQTHYGHKPEGTTIWPSCESSNSLRCLTSCVRALYEEIEKEEKLKETSEILFID